MEWSITHLRSPLPTREATLVFNRHQRMPAPLELVVVNGPNRGHRYPLVIGRQSYGRSPHNDIVIDDTTVSNRHGLIDYTKDNQIICYDISSTNGISRNGRTAPVVELRVGQIIQIGAVYLKLTPAGEAIVAKRRFPWWLFLAIFIAGNGYWFLSTSPLDLPAAKPPPPKTTQTTATSLPAKKQAVGKKRIRHNQTAREMVTLGELEERASAAFRAGRHSEAYSLWNQVLQKEPHNFNAQEGLGQLERVASRMYEEALMTQALSPDQSQELLRTAMAITPASSSIHQRAGRLIGKVM